MKGYVDEKGHLYIIRAGVSKAQYCPYTIFNTSCGDYCPLFGEPVKDEHKIYLSICQRLLMFTELVDRRE